MKELQKLGHDMSHDGGVARWTTANAEEDLKAKEERHRDAKEKFEAAKERRQGKKMMSDEMSKGLADTTAVDKAAWLRCTESS